MTNDTKPVKLPPLKITCTSANCESALHCFMPTKKMEKEGDAGKCRYCGADLVNWTRIHQRNVRNVDYVFRSLKYEMFRHYMWHVDIDIKAVNHARRKGFSGLRLAAEKRLTKYISPAKPPFDGRQTPREGSGNSICYAQHATATCCRKCLEYWHGIPQFVELSDEDITYFNELVMRYIHERLPFLTEDGEKVPPIRKKQ